MILVFRSTVLPIRVKVDDVYRKLQQFCDILEGITPVSHDPNPHDLRISESNELLDGVKNLFDKSDADEQIRLMTIAPKTWGRQKMEKWFVSTAVFSSIFFPCLIIHQVSNKTKSSETITNFTKRKRNVSLSSELTRKYAIV